MNKQITDLDNQITRVRQKITEAISRDLGVYYFVKAQPNNYITAKQILNEMKQIGITVTNNPDPEFTPDQNDIQEVDLRINVQYTTQLLQDLRELQDKKHDLLKLEMSKHTPDSGIHHI